MKGVDRLLVKTRVEPKELKILRTLNDRFTLKPKDKNNYISLEKGQIGERLFDYWLEKLGNDSIVLNDLLLEQSNSLFQIDSLLIKKQIYLFEIKNYEGDYYMENDTWYSTPRNEIKNPLLQLKRSESLLRRLLNEHGFNIPIESWVVFINPQFQLYQAPLDAPIIFPAQLQRFFDKLQSNTSPLNHHHTNLSHLLQSLHLPESPYLRLPDYQFETLQKGIVCFHCHSLNTAAVRKNIICTNCGSKETIQSAVLRSVEECILLFPDLRITTDLIYRWCKIVNDPRTVRKALSSQYKQSGGRKCSYYVQKS